MQCLTPDVLLNDDWEDVDDSGSCDAGTDAGTSNCANYSGTNYTTVKGLAESVYTTFTVPLNDIITENNGAIVMLNDLRALLVAIEDDIDLIDQQEDVVLSASDGVTEGVSEMMEDIYVRASRPAVMDVWACMREGERERDGRAHSAHSGRAAGGGERDVADQSD